MLRLITSNTFGAVVGGSVACGRCTQSIGVLPLVVQTATIDESRRSL